MLTSFNLFSEFSISCSIFKSIPYNIRHTKYFAYKLNNFPIPENSLQVIMECQSLYASIPNSEGITAIKRKHDNYQKKTIFAKVVREFWLLIISSPNHIFYFQTKSCAMEICLPAHTDIFMLEFEEKYTKSLNHFFFLVIYRRYGLD